MKNVRVTYYEQLHTYKFDNFDEIDQYLERHEVPKLTVVGWILSSKAVFAYVIVKDLEMKSSSA